MRTRRYEITSDDGCRVEVCVLIDGDREAICSIENCVGQITEVTVERPGGARVIQFILQPGWPDLGLPSSSSRVERPGWHAPPMEEIAGDVAIKLKRFDPGRALLCPTCGVGFPDMEWKSEYLVARSAGPDRPGVGLEWVAKPGEEELVAVICPRGHRFPALK
jgi:hypothetical protein